MKKQLLLTAALFTGLCFATVARAETPVTASPAAAPAAAAPANSQNTKMKDCAAQYHQQNLPKSQYHTFMSTCLKKGSSAGTTPAAASAPIAAPVPSASGVTKTSTSAPETTQQDKMKSCNAQAKSQSLTGADRKSFMKTCLSK